MVERFAIVLKSLQAHNVISSSHVYLTHVQMEVPAPALAPALPVRVDPGIPEKGVGLG